MNAIYDVIRKGFALIFGPVLAWFYSLTGSYVLSIVALTLIIRLALLPLSIKQQKNSAKQVRLNTKVNKIRQKYAGNQQKIQEETQALYQREGFGAQNMGCMPLLFQMIVMIGLYGVIYTPLSSVLRFANSTIENMASIMSIDITGNNARMYEITILEKFADFKDALLNGGISAEALNSLYELKEKYTIFGLELTGQPKMSEFNALWLIPLLSFATSMLSAVYMYIKQRKQNPEMAKNPAMGCMTFMSPAMSLMFTFMFPAGVGFYWIVSNIISFVQQVALATLYSPKKVIAQQMVDETVVRRSKERNAKLRAENDKK